MAESKTATGVGQSGNAVRESAPEKGEGKREIKPTARASPTERRSSLHHLSSVQGTLSVAADLSCAEVNPAQDATTPLVLVAPETTPLVSGTGRCRSKAGGRRSAICPPSRVSGQMALGPRFMEGARAFSSSSD